MPKADIAAIMAMAKKSKKKSNGKKTTNGERFIKAVELKDAGEVEESLRDIVDEFMADYEKTS